MKKIVLLLLAVFSCVNLITVTTSAHGTTAEEISPHAMARPCPVCTRRTMIYSITDSKLKVTIDKACEHGKSGYRDVYNIYVDYYTGFCNDCRAKEPGTYKERAVFVECAKQ